MFCGVVFCAMSPLGKNWERPLGEGFQMALWQVTGNFPYPVNPGPGIGKQRI